MTLLSLDKHFAFGAFSLNVLLEANDSKPFAMAIFRAKVIDSSFSFLPVHTFLAVWNIFLYVLALCAMHERRGNELVCSYYLAFCTIL